MTTMKKTITTLIGATVLASTFAAGMCLNARLHGAPQAQAVSEDLGPIDVRCGEQGQFVNGHCVAK